MADRLGQLLLAQKLISSKQLEEALKNQAIFGGRLGSQLVDSGALDEVDLARLLGQQHRVPFAHSVHLDSLNRDLLAALPVVLAEKYLVLPLKLESKRLYLAMPDPGDLAAIEEIGFRTGLVVRPVVAPESTILKGLKRHYGITRIGRSIRLEPEPEKAPPPKSREPAQDDPGAWLGGPEADSMMAAWEQSGRTPRADGPAEDRSPLATLGERLAANLDRESMAELVIEALGAEVGTAALLLVKNEVAVGWRAVREGRPVGGYDLVQVALDRPSILQTVSLGKSSYLGPAADLQGNRQFLAPLGTPDRALVVPVLLLGRLVGMICVGHPDRDLQDLLPSVQKVAFQLALGLEMLILKNKLTSM